MIHIKEGVNYKPIVKSTRVFYNVFRIGDFVFLENKSKNPDDTFEFLLEYRKRMESLFKVKVYKNYVIHS